MPFPNTDYPGAVDGAQTRVDAVDTIWANDFNYPDEQILALQNKLGATGDLIGDDAAGHGIGGAISSVATGGTAFQFAARDAYLAGTLFTVGDDYDVAYVPKLALDFDGNFGVVGRGSFGGGRVLSQAAAPVSEFEANINAVHGVADIGYLTFSGQDALGAGNDYARITGRCVSDAAGAETGSLRFLTCNAGVLAQSLEIENDGTLNVAAVANYETLVLADDDIPNRKFVTDLVTAENLWDRSGTTVYQHNAGDTVQISDTVPTPILQVGLTQVHGALVDLGYIDFIGKDAGGAAENYGRIAGRCSADGAGAEAGVMRFSVYIGGVFTQVLEIEADGTLNVSGVTNYETLVTADDDIPNRKWVNDLFSAGKTAVYTFGGGGSGDIATMTFTNGLLTGVTTVP